MSNRFVLNREDRKLMGVAAGIADFTGVDVLLIRLGLVAALLLTGPVVLLFYVLTGWLANDR
ncbi:PspC domain-containing protein [Sphingomonas sabuli]|uniref:PspC domain-containing protein n=1 Tax=Sphingomonas sabuli TaxID=2764186 RepID=A0A7G9L0A2_9SPHN|nr:PspC domain-containing protein [Sphingomonas sabuli]QNM82051.1 PspC domain-containing protein [Sphingomonas sabuli]